jgi:propionate CoA-transferase
MLDMAFLGGAEIDANGDVNVSYFGGRCIGAGGYIDISQNAKKVFFMGTFTTKSSTTGKKPVIDCTGDGLAIKEDGDGKLVQKVQQITFSADYARENGQEVMYITERAVFRLVKEGLELIEIAPGVDLEKDVLDKMAFKPIISPQLKLMDARLFNEAVMGIKDEILSKA